MSLISIIIPVYNADLYLRQSLQSVIDQSFDDWECIVVNDGSTDESLEIIKEFASLTQRIRYFTIPNSGCADIPRNYGISQSIGDWICCLDADDYIEVAYLDSLYKRVLETTADAVLGRMFFFENDSNAEIEIVPTAYFDMNQELSGKDACALTIGEWKIGASGLMKRDRYMMDISAIYANTDELNTRIRFLHCNKIVFCDVRYFYRIHSNSITNKISIKLFDRLITDDILVDLVEKNYSELSGLPKRVRKYKLDNLIEHYRIFLKNKHNFSQAEIFEIKRRLVNSYLTLNIPELRVNVPLHYKISYLISYKFFNIFIFMKIDFIIQRLSLLISKILKRCT